MKKRAARTLVVATVVFALLNASCATSLIMITPYQDRRPEQYRLLWVDGAVVAAAVGIGAPLYATSDPETTGERVGLGLLLGAAVWAGWTLILGAMLRMPGQQGGGGWLGMRPSPTTLRCASERGRWCHGTRGW